MDKKLYKGDFNILGQTFSLRTKSISKGKAFLNFIHQLHKKTSIPKFQLYSMFNGDKDNYYIEEV